MNDEIVMRAATEQDAGAITTLHVASWQSSYRGVLPDSYLDGEAETERGAHWNETLSGLGPKDLVLLAEDEQGLRGFISVYWRKEPGFDAYLDNLHVRPGHRGGGLGRQLLAGALQRLIAQGARNLCLWAFDQNQGAIRFYERLGGRSLERGFDDFAGSNAPHTKIAWDDLPAFLAACKKGTSP
ncbi:MAG: GNAT family N-acetyltransferase [Alphaproteobacteria bacterium]|nr:GNAT family N-acetyltransferase [Alphaproteobacteria bacterium]